MMWVLLTVWHIVIVCVQSSCFWVPCVSFCYLYHPKTWWLNKCKYYCYNKKKNLLISCVNEQVDKFRVSKKVWWRKIIGEGKLQWCVCICELAVWVYLCVVRATVYSCLSLFFIHLSQSVSVLGRESISYSIEVVLVVGIRKKKGTVLLAVHSFFFSLFLSHSPFFIALVWTSPVFFSWTHKCVCISCPFHHNNKPISLPPIWTSISRLVVVVIGLE